MKSHLVWGLLLGVACSRNDGVGEVAEMGGESGRTRDSDQCISDAECADGLFCNGAELCLPGEEDADAFGCIEARRQPECDDGLRCTVDVCSDALGQCVFASPDEDGDGHRDAACENALGEPLGDDCDDEDPNRFPGNLEVCDYEHHDEDCDLETYGERDRDGDSEFDAACCNVGEDDEEFCGTDCNDLSIAQRSKQPEFCDNVDNDCNGLVDDNPGPVAWYLDEDGDLFGGAGAEAVYSCEPIPGSSLLPTDCRDDIAGLHPAQLELCDGIDNDCDSLIDEPSYCDQGGGIVVPEGTTGPEPIGSGGQGNSGSGGGNQGTGGDDNMGGAPGAGGNGGSGGGGTGGGGTGGGGNQGTGGGGVIIGGEPTVLWADDFESGFGNWGVDGGEWAIGAPTFADGPAPRSGANVAGTDLLGSYGYSASARLVTPSFTVPAVEERPRLKFSYWYFLGVSDIGTVQIKVGAEEWVAVEGTTISATSRTWAPGMILLDAWAGETIQVGFLLESDNDVYTAGGVAPGWYIDDVSLETGPMAWEALEDFEDGYGDWSVEGGQWAMGEPTAATGPESAYSGSNLAGTVLEGEHGYLQNARLVTPMFTVPAGSLNPRLNFAFWYWLGVSDTGVVQIRPASGTWETFTAWGTLTGDSPAWAPSNVNLSAFAEQSIQVGFLLTTNSDVYTAGGVGPGWYIDNVQLLTD